MDHIGTIITTPHAGNLYLLHASEAKCMDAIGPNYVTWRTVNELFHWRDDVAIFLLCIKQYCPPIR